MGSISVNTGNWALWCAAEKYTKQTMLSKDLNSFKANKAITHLCSNYQLICLGHILIFNVHFKTIILWILIYK